MNDNEQKSSRLIIAADDDLTMAVMVEALAKSAGFTAKVYGDGKYVLEALEQFNAALVVLDVKMPDMDGFEVCQKIRANKKDEILSLPVLIITGSDDLQSLQAAHAAGANDIMPKPINWNLFKGLVTWMADHYSDCNSLMADSNLSGREIIILDASDLQIVHANLNSCLNMGLPGSELREKNIIDIIAEEDHDKLLLNLEETSSMLDAPYQLEVNMVRSDKSKYPARIMFFSAMDEFPGMIVGIAVPLN